MSKLAWTNEKCKLGDLTPQPDNPRQIRASDVDRLLTSFEDYSQVDPLAIGPNGEIYNGHQRYQVFLNKYGPDYEVDVRVSSRELSHKEWQRLTVLLHEGATGEWDFDELANWDVELDELLAWGFDESDLQLDWGKDEDSRAKDKDGELTISPELLERHDYLVFYFDNELDWQVASQVFGVKQVLNGAVGKSTLKHRGLGRVLAGQLLLEALASD